MGEALERGILFHASIAEYYKARQAGEKHAEGVAVAMATLASLQVTSLAYAPFKLTAEVATLLDLYFKNYGDEPLRIIGVETEYSVGMLDDYELPVRIDVIWEDYRDGTVSIVDHKVVKDPYEEKKIRLMPQLKLYKFGIDLMGEIKVDNIVYNQVRHRTTNDNRNNPALRFERVSIPFNTFTTNRTVTEHLYAGNRIAAWKRMGLEEWDEKVLRNPNACYMCSFQDLCAQDLEGEDTTLLKQYEYRQKTPRHEMTN